VIGDEVELNLADWSTPSTIPSYIGLRVKYQSVVPSSRQWLRLRLAGTSEELLTTLVAEASVPSERRCS